jgi:DNA-directed RNA polymerase
MISQALTRDMNSIRKLGIDALTEKLGPIGMVEFMRQFDSGYGDYTKERQTWLNNLTIEDISNEIKRATQGG